MKLRGNRIRVKQSFVSGIFNCCGKTLTIIQGVGAPTPWVCE
jgi:hypothetical protein